MATGRVVRFDEVRGYGFIAPDEGGEDVFVHVNALRTGKHEVTAGTPVEFEMEEGERGRKALSVRPLTRAAPATPAAAEWDADDSCDVLSATEYVREVTELLIEHVPSMTGGQLAQARQVLVKRAQEHGWVEP